ncbi:hypothetical protein V8201_17365 [Sphingomonas kyungheensis]|uniref:Uncharacterized protein n=2 Tax=Sphingomonadaceae TaxID=41297 RepID=A0ABU8H7D3_9SPHN
MLALAAMPMEAAMPADVNGHASAWAVAYDQHNCTLSRSSGAGPMPAGLVIDADPVSGEGDFMLR